MATLEQKYFHDRLMLLLVSIAAFLVFLGSILILLRLDGGRNEGFIVQYRQTTGITDFQTGNASELLAFILFMFIALGLNLIISMRVYKTSRNYAASVLGLGLVVQLLAVIVSNALLVLR